jgi:addiction module HigA family antidote
MAIARTQPLAGPVPHPDEALKGELEARGLSAHALAVALGLPASRVNQIVRGQRAITPETALHLPAILAAPPHHRTAKIPNGTRSNASLISLALNEEEPGSRQG